MAVVDGFLFLQIALNNNFLMAVLCYQHLLVVTFSNEKGNLGPNSWQSIPPKCLCSAPLPFLCYNCIRALLGKIEKVARKNTCNCPGEIISC